MTKTNQPLILSLRASGLGDLLTAVPALRAVKRRWPECDQVLAGRPGLGAVVRSIGAVDRRVSVAVGGEVQRIATNVGVGVNLHGSGPESHNLLLRNRPGELIAYRHPDVPESRGGPEWDPNEHDVSRWCRLVQAYGIPADPGDLDLHVTRETDTVPPGVRGATLLHPGAAAPARRWPIERWTALAASVVADGQRAAITAGPGEIEDALAIAENVPQVTIVDCADDLGLLIRVVAAGKRIVCGDTGVAHLATALRTPSVVLFGPVSPQRWGPPPDRPWHIALWAGRSGDPHGACTDPGLLEIAVIDVLLALHRLPLARRATSCAA